MTHTNKLNNKKFMLHKIDAKNKELTCMSKNIININDELDLILPLDSNRSGNFVVDEILENRGHKGIEGDTDSFYRLKYSIYTPF